MPSRTKPYTRWDDPLRQAHVRGRRRKAFDEAAAQSPLASMDEWERVILFVESYRNGDDQTAFACLRAGRVRLKGTMAGVFNHLVRALSETA